MPTLSDPAVRRRLALGLVIPPPLSANRRRRKPVRGWLLALSAIGAAAWACTTILTH